MEKPSNVGKIFFVITAILGILIFISGVTIFIILGEDDSESLVIISLTTGFLLLILSLIIYTKSHL